MQIVEEEEKKGNDSDENHDLLKKKLQPGKTPIKFQSQKKQSLLENQDKVQNQKKELEDVVEEFDSKESDELPPDLFPDKPAYFDEFDYTELDSEDELVAGENNYIEIKCLPFDLPEPPIQQINEDNEEQQPALINNRTANEGADDKAGDKADVNLPAHRIEEEKKEEDETPDGNDKKPEEEKKAPAVVDAAAEEEENFCRFCWDASSVIQNPLLSVCKCSGGVGFVHFLCLKHWLKTKMTEQRTFTSWTIYWKSFGCEICHHVYPYIFKAAGRKYSLIDIKLPDSDYIMLESLTLEKSTSRIIQILKPHMRVHTFRFGRGLDQDLRVNDISVSRYHAQIKFLYDKFLLMDNLSKFGTLVMVKKGLEIFPGQSRSIQVGRTLINLHLSYQKPNIVKTNQIMYAPKSELEKIAAQKKQGKVDEQVSQIYASLKENEMYQRRQKMIHMQLNENNFDVNNIYLQRRQLNFQDEEHVQYASDEEEKKFMEQLEAENEEE